MLLPIREGGPDLLTVVMWDGAVNIFDVDSNVGDATWPMTSQGVSFRIGHGVAAASVAEVPSAGWRAVVCATTDGLVVAARVESLLDLRASTFGPVLDGSFGRLTRKDARGHVESLCGLGGRGERRKLVRRGSAGAGGSLTLKRSRCHPTRSLRRTTRRPSKSSFVRGKRRDAKVVYK
jgi:hypothetical protein